MPRSRLRSFTLEKTHGDCGDMTKDMVSKLHLHLEKPVDTECSVVYLLAEVRKLLDRDDPKHRYAALWMYCHWALHVDLDLPKTTSDFLKQVDLWVTNNIAYLVPSGPWKFIQEYYLFRDFIYLDTFRKQLRLFLTAYKLPKEICTNESKWFEFISAYAGVIEDGTLACESKKNNELGAVQRVVFKKGKTLSRDHHVDFVIQWDIELKDGRTLKTEFKALPNSPGKMTSHHLQVIQGTFVPPPPKP